MNLHLILLVICLIEEAVSAPPGRVNTPSKIDGTPPEKKPRKDENQCYFKVLRKTATETKARPEKSKVSTNCKDERLIKIGDLKNYQVNAVTGERNAIELLICRGTGQCDLDYSDVATQNKWKNIHICEDHADELLRKWSDTNSPYERKHIYRKTGHEECSMPDEIGIPHTKRPADRITYLKISEADAILKATGVLVHPGIPICYKHREYISGLSSNKHLNSKSSETTTATNNNNAKKDPTYKQPVSSPKSELDQKFKEFAKAADTDRVCDARIPFGNLKDRTKQKKVCSVRKLIDVMIGIVAPQDTEELKKMVVSGYNPDTLWSIKSSKKIDNLLQQIAAQYFLAEDRKSRLTVLSLAANTIPYSEVQKYIPNLSSHMYQSAKKFARRRRNVETPPRKLEKYNPEAVHCLVDFLTSPIVMIGLPFGVLKVKMPDGSKHEIPNSIRQQSNSEIYDMYKTYLEETDQNHLILSQSSVFRILNVCAATKRKSTTCVDYFVADGMEAFDELHVIVDGWISDQFDDKDFLTKMKTALFEIAQYLRTDYRLHVKPDSRIPDHCSMHSLSDPKDVSMATSCSSRTETHTHDLRCARCEHMNRTMEEIKKYAKFLIPEDKGAAATTKEKEQLEKRTTENEIIAVCFNKILEMKKHFLRAAVSNQERTNLIDGLQDNEALITLDFAQKFFPKWHREKQIDYFGKRGINYHISHVTARIGETWTQHSFVHIYDTEVSQNSGLVVLTIAHVASELKKVGIKRMSLRSDNAGAYHCASTIGSLHWINETFGVDINTYTFSEAQNGKSSSDRDANRVKRKANSYHSENHDVTTPAEFFASLKNGKLLNGLSVHYGSVSVETSSETKWSGIKNLNHFTLELNGIRGKRYGNIGTGQFLEKKNLKPLKGTYNFEEAGFVASGIESVAAERKAVAEDGVTKFWFQRECSKKKNCLKEDDDTSPEIDDFPENPAVIGNLFACSEPGCSASFLKLSNLEKHNLRGKHKIAPERITLLDFSLGYYVQRLEDVEKTKTCPTIGDAMEEVKKSDDDSDAERGWALPSKQARVPFDLDVKNFLIQCFDEGTKKGAKHVDPKTVEKRMETEKKADGSLRFAVSQRKNFRQIAAFFSREAEKRKTTTSRRKRAQDKQIKSTDDIEDFVVSEDEHPDAGWLRYRNHEATPVLADEFYEAIINSDDPIFLYDETST